MEIYVVKSGDSLYSIGRRYGVTASQLQAYNLISNESLVVGQTICIPSYKTVYTVRAGDTLLSIADQYGVSVNQLWRNNQILGGKDNIYEGQTLVIEYGDTPEMSFASNGYTYPYIDRDLLRATLPYLTFMTVFTYGFTEDADLIIPNDDEVIRISKEYGTSPIMLLSTLGENGKFSNALSNSLLQSVDKQNKLIDQIINVMGEKGYRGLDIDFEYIYPSDKNAFADFVSLARNRLNELGYFVVVALAPKISDDQSGLLYEGHDYALLGAVADYVLIMTYEWGYTYGPPLPVAPIDKVEEVVKYAVSRIPADKIFMGMPNYGYVWKLPFVKGESKADSLSNVGAVALAREVGAEILFDDNAKTPYFTFYRDGVENICYFEDARSVKSKLDLIKKYSLLGGSWWNIMRFFPQNWAVLNYEFNID